MKHEEAGKLKPGDLVILDSRHKNYGGLVLEVAEVNPVHDNWCYRITLKQPGFDEGFRIKDCDSRYLQRYEAN